MRVNSRNRIAAWLLMFFMMINMLVGNIPVSADTSAASSPTAVTTTASATTPEATAATDSTATNPASAAEVTPQPAAPALVNAGTDASGAVIEAQFDKVMADPGSDKAQFTVNNGAADLVTAAALKTGDNTVIVLTLTNAIQYGQTVTLAYTAGTVTSADTGSLAAFTAHTVTNNVPQAKLQSIKLQSVEQLTISEARTKAIGTNVAVTGIVTYVNGASNYFIQDSTAGIDVYKSGLSPKPQQGDQITVTGLIAAYSGLIEIAPAAITDVSIQSSGNSLPAPKPVTIADANTGNDESQLVKIQNVTLGAIDTANTTPVTDAAGHTINIYKIPALTGIIAGDKVDVIAVVSNYSGPELLVRSAADIVKSAAIVEAPLFASAFTTTDGTQIEVKFSKAMADPTGKQAQFTVNNGVADPVTAAALKTGDATVIVLTLTSAIQNGQTVTAAYTAGDVTAADTGGLASFTAQSVTNNVVNPSISNVEVLATSDLHGTIYPYDYFSASTVSEGLAKVSTYVKQERQSNPNLMLVDNGDTIQGTPLATYYATIDKTSLNPMIKVMGAMQYDTWTLGNHEFNFGLDMLNKVITEAKNDSIHVLSANTYKSDNSNLVDPYYIKTIPTSNGDVKVGILGLTTKCIPNWESPANYADLHFNDLVDEANKWVPIMQAAGADIIVATIHSGEESASDIIPENQIKALAQGVNGIDAIVAGHTHAKINQDNFTNPSGKTVIVTEPGKWGQYVSKLQFAVQKQNGQWAMVNKSSQAVPMDSSITADSSITTLVQPNQDATMAYLNTKIGTAADVYSGTNQLTAETAIMDLINKVQQQVSGAQLSIAAPLSSSALIPKGDVTIKDISSVYIYENYLYSINMTGAQLKKWLEFSARYYQQVSSSTDPVTKDTVLNIPDYNLDQLYGANYTIDLTQPAGSRIKNLTYNGNLIKDTDVFTVAINNYRYNGGGGFMAAAGLTPGQGAIYDSMKTLGDAGQVRNLLIKYVQDQQTITPTVASYWTASTVPVAAPGASDKVIINQVYGEGGDYGVTGAPVSNSFVELYNPTDHDINLAGWSLQYKPHWLPTDKLPTVTSDIPWVKLDLTGTIPSHCSFLVRGKAAVKPGTINLDLSKITPDQDWSSQSFNNKGVEIVLLKNTNLLTVQNPFNADGNGTKVDGYVDMLGVGGNDGGTGDDVIDGCETTYSSVQSKQKALRRIEFADTDNNAADFEVIGYNSVYIVPWAKPRTVSDGSWTTSGVKPVAPNETLLDPLKPNTLTNTFISDSKTTREFTWETPVSVTTGQIQLIENTTGAALPNAAAQVITADRTESTNLEGPIAVYRVAATGLKPGTSYLYRAGNDSGWSNVYSFTTEANDDHSFTFLHASDTQAVTKADYNVWGAAATKEIAAHPQTSFILETGDLIDTTDREDEWRSFFLACPDVFGDYAFMPVVGNHDQANGDEAASFRQHFTVASNGAPAPVTSGTTYSFDYGDAHFSILNTETDLAAQTTWLDNDLSKTSKKWKIVALHRGMYEASSISTTLLSAFGPILDKYSVDLVLQGHDHVYMKTFKMKNGVKGDTGTIHLESGGAGAKQDNAGSPLGYEDVLKSIGKPTYSAITVAKDALTVDTQDYNSTSKSIEEINTFTLTKADPDKSFDIVEITDLHGNIGDTTATNQVAAVLAENIKDNVYANNPDRTLILSAGDNYQGTAISNLQYGDPVMKVFNAMGLDASALGNHEFDWGLEKVTNVNGSKITANYPTVCANLFLKGTTTPVFDPYKIFTKDGVKIAVVGGITETTPGIVLAANIANYDIGSNVTYINKYAQEARAAGAQIVIALIHEGDNYNNGASGPIVDIANQLVGVDAVLGGHTHTIVQNTVTNKDGKTIPMEIANYNGKGYIDLKVTLAADGTFTFNNAKSAYVAQDTTSTVYPYGYKANPLVADQTVQQIVADTMTAEGPILNEVLGSAQINVTRTQADSPYGESLAGNWATDIVRIRGNADFGFQNNGGLRCDIPSGTLTMSNIYQFMPFDNVIETCDMTGAQLKVILEEAVMDNGKGIQLSGLKFTYNPTQPSGSRVTGITRSDGTPIDINDTTKTYKVATNDFMAGGTTASPKDGFTFASQSSNMTNTYILVRDALAEAVKAAGTTGITAQIEGRIKNSTTMSKPLTSTVKFAVFSDPHYFAPELGTSGAAFDQYLASDRKMIAESKAILESAVTEIKNSDAQIVLVTGDLTKDGEYVSETQFAGYLQQLKDAGKKVYVINGNHDINNPNASSYSGAKATPIQATTPADFKVIYNDFGYGDAVAVDPNSLSYAVDPIPGLRIIAMDSCIYGQTAGAFTADRQAWIDKEIADGVAQGMTVIGMMHHGITNHFSLESSLFPEYVIQNADTVASDLYSKGMKAVFTGHFHAQDITKAPSGLFDIETGSLVTSPVPYRLVELNPNGDVKITSQRINTINYDTGGKSFQTYARDFLVQGLNGLVPQMLAGIIMQQNPSLTKDQAMAAANTAATQPVTTTLTVKDCLVNAMVAHYQGDEQCDPQLLAVYQQMYGSTDALTKTLGGALLSLNTDLAPGDNNTNLNLITGAYTQPVLAVPQLVSASTDTSGKKVLVKFDKTMADPTGKQAEFGVLLNTATDAVLSASISPTNSTTIELTLTTPIANGNVITVAYTKGTIKSNEGVALESFANITAINNIAADAVSKVTATINGDPTSSEGFTWYTGVVSASSDLQLVESTELTPDFSQALKFTGLYTASTNAPTQRVHKAKASGLKPGTTYAYRVGDAFLDIWSATGTFQTAPASGAFTFIDLADTQANDESEATLSSQTIAKALNTVDNADFVALNGDIVETGGVEGQWDWMLGHAQDSLLNTTIVPAAGNHEAYALSGKASNALIDHFNLKSAAGSDTTTGAYYSYDYSNAHFLVLNTNESSTDYADFSPAQIQWMQADVAAAKAAGARWIIAIIHKGPYTTANHATDTDIKDTRTKVSPIMANLGIDLVLEGHDHIYARSKPIKADGTAASVNKISADFNGSDIEYTQNPGAPIYLIPGAAGAKVYAKNTKISDSTNSAYVAGYYNLFDVADQSHAAIYGLDTTGTPQRGLIQNFEGITVDGDKLSVISYEIDQNKNGAKPYIIDSFGITKPIATVSKVTAAINGDPSTSEGFTWYTGTASAGSDLQLVKNGGLTPDFSQAISFTGLYAASTNDPTQRMHKAKATGLRPGTTYSYRVGDVVLDIWSATGTFQTAPASGAFAFIDLADTQANDESEAALSSQTIAKALNTVDGAKFVALNGDVVETGNNEGQWDWMLGHSQNSLLNTTIVPIAGNHENQTNAFMDHFDVKPADGSDTSKGAYYSYDYSNAHFLVLNTNESSTAYADFSPAQIQWMQADVAAAKAAGARWIIAILHKGPYTTANHATDTDIKDTRTKVSPIMANLGIDLVLEGHDHIYARSKPIKADGTAASVNMISAAFNGSDIEYTQNPGAPIYLIPGAAGAKVYYKNTKISDPTNSAYVAGYYDLFDVADQNHAAPYGPDPSDTTRPVRGQIQNFEGITIDGDMLSVISYEIDQSKDEAKPYVIDSFGITKQSSVVAPATIATIKSLTVLDSNQQPVTAPLVHGKQYYLNWKAGKNSDGTAAGLAIMEVLDANNQASFLNAARLQVPGSPDTEYSALFQPATSGSFKVKGFFWSDWSNSATWQSLADPVEASITVN